MGRYDWEELTTLFARVADGRPEYVKLFKCIWRFSMGIKLTHEKGEES